MGVISAVLAGLLVVPLAGAQASQAGAAPAPRREPARDRSWS